MHSPVHPGRILSRGYLEPLGLSVQSVSEAIGVSADELGDLIEEKGSVTADMAIRLERAFGLRAEMWTGLQTQYDLARARKREIKVERLLPQRAMA